MEFWIWCRSNRRDADSCSETSCDGDAYHGSSNGSDCDRENRKRHCANEHEVFYHRISCAGVGSERSTESASNYRCGCSNETYSLECTERTNLQMTGLQSENAKDSSKTVYAFDHGWALQNVHGKNDSACE